MSLRSMTGYACVEGVTPDGTGWRWELRSVNGRGLDLRFRLPEGTDSLEPGLRKMAQTRLRRGSLTVQLRLSPGQDRSAAALQPHALQAAVTALREAEAAARAARLPLAPVTAEALLRVAAGLVRETVPAAPEALAARDAALTEGFAQALDALDLARAAEGGALKRTFDGILDAIEARTAEAGAAHVAQTAAAPARLRARVDALLEARATAEPERLAQELALLAIRNDVQEEIDRLRAHTAAARDLLEADGPVGRQLDFLSQEFNREVNTLCSKSDSTALTDAGLAMKVLIDQLREQAQNVE
jgi:uncharacterized protein (TIGR00255 family)